MIPILMPARKYRQLQDDSAKNLFHTVGIIVPRDEEMTVVRKVSMFITTPLIRGMDIAFDTENVHRLGAVNVYPIYLNQILFVGYMCVRKYGKMCATKLSRAFVGSTIRDSMELTDLGSLIAVRLGDSIVLIPKDAELEV